MLLGKPLVLNHRHKNKAKRGNRLHSSGIANPALSLNGDEDENEPRTSSVTQSSVDILMEDDEEDEHEEVVTLKNKFSSIVKFKIIYFSSSNLVRFLLNKLFTQSNTFWVAFRTQHRICVYGL